MELEIMYDRGFYEAKAAEHPILEQVIAGETTLTNHLDEVVAQFKPSTAFFASPDGSQFVNHFSEHVKMLAELSEGKIKLSDYKEFETVRQAVYLGGVIPLGYAIGMLFVPLGLPLAATLLLAGACGGGGAVLYDKLLQKVGQPVLRKKRAKLLEPVYELSSQLDRDIGRCFLLDHFDGARPRFEQTYIALGQEERAQVDERLYSFLGVGGIRDMDETQLKDYLTGLLEPETVE